MKIDRVRSIQVRAEWDYHEPLGETGLARPTFHLSGTWKRRSRAGPSRT